MCYINEVLFVCWCLQSCFVCMQREAKRSWFNLTAQEIQPLYYRTELEGQGWLRSRGCPEDAWNGGCSLLLDGLIPATHTSPVSAKCVCFLFTFALFSNGGSLTIHAHLFCISQDLLPPCTPGFQDSGDPHLQAVCWDHSFPGAEDNRRQSLHTRGHPGCQSWVSHNPSIIHTRLCFAGTERIPAIIIL